MRSVLRVGLATFVAMGLWTLLPARESLAGHPVGAVSEASASKVGNAKLKLIECLDCHVSHGGAADDLLAGRDHAATACVNCHKGLDLETHADAHPVDELVPRRAAEAVRKVGGLLGPNNTVVCGSCHTAHGDDEEDMDARCFACHEEQAAVAIEAATKEEGHRSGACRSCHNQESAEMKAEAPKVEGDPSNCLRCHGPGTRNQSVDAHPGQAGHALVDREGGFDADDDRPLDGCTSCHGGHEIVRPDSDLCERCHTEQRDDHARGGHGTATCIDCHPPHEERAMHADAPDHHLNPVSRRCLACHAEDAPGDGEVSRVESYEHPAPVFLPDGVRWTPLGDLPLFDEKGVKLPPNVNGDLTCASCHLSHGPDRNKPGDSLRRPGWERACSACHDVEALLFYRWFHYRERLEGVVTPIPGK